MYKIFTCEFFVHGPLFIHSFFSIRVFGMELSGMKFIKSNIL